MLMAGRPTKLSDLVREPAALQEARRRARTIRAKAIELQEERGITAGFIAVGMATWTVPGASRPPAAPVLLRSCVLQGDRRGAAGLRPRPRRRRRAQPGARALPALRAGPASSTPTRSPTSSMVSKGFDPHPTFAALQRAVRGHARLLDHPAAGGRHLLLRQAADGRRPRRRRATRSPTTTSSPRWPVTPTRSRRCGSAVPAAAPDPEPDREHLVLDADSSQQAVIEAVRAGANLVIKGPPGTGKSQTIANLIASLVRRRQAGAVRRREARRHRRRRRPAGPARPRRPRARRPQRRDEPPRGWPRSSARPSSGPATPRTPTPPRSSGRCVDRRTRLTDHAAALHERREPWGVSAYDAQVALTQLTQRVQRPDLPGAHPRRGPAGGVAATGSASSAAS